MLIVLIAGKLARLRELLVSYNRVQSLPKELGCCENLEKLDLAMNRDLDELPTEVPVSVTNSTKTFINHYQFKCMLIENQLKEDRKSVV